MKQFLFNVPEELFLEAKHIAQEKRVALADIIRKALREEIAVYKKQQKKNPTKKNILVEMASHAVEVGNKVSYAKDIDNILYGKR